jgi:hypothetical protein
MTRLKIDSCQCVAILHLGPKSGVQYGKTVAVLLNFIRFHTFWYSKSFRLKLFGGRALSTCAPRLWNSLPISLRSETDLDTFKRNLKTFIFQSHFKVWQDNFFLRSAFEHWWKRYTNLNFIHSFIVHHYLWCSNSWILHSKLWCDTTYFEAWMKGWGK